MTNKKVTATKKDIPVMAADGSINFTFTVPATDVKHGYEEVVQEYAAKAELKGFRKGKAPVALVEQSLDKNKVYGHVLEHIIPPAYGAALDKYGFRPLVDPKLTPVSMEEGKDWEFKAETAGIPEIKLGDYRKYVAQAIKDAPQPKVEDQETKDKPEDAKLTVALDALLKNAEIAIAPILVEEEARTALSKLVNQLAALKLTVDDYAKSIKKSREELVQEYQKTAETNLKVEFLISAVAKDLDLKIEEKDPYKKYAAERRGALDFLSGL